MGPYLLLQLGGRPDFLVRPGHKITFGRHGKNDVILSDTSVSRVHAFLCWYEEFPKIFDCSSMSGTKVDGTSVQIFELSTEHCIKLGKTVISACYTAGTAKTKSAEETMLDSAIREDLDECNSVVLLKEMSHGEVNGMTSSVEDLHKLLLGLEQNKRTGTLTLSAGTPETVVGHIVFGLGKICQAQHEDKIGQQALLKLCLIPNITFNFIPKVTVQELTLEVSPAVYLRQVKQLTRCSWYK